MSDRIIELTFFTAAVFNTFWKPTTSQTLEESESQPDDAISSKMAFSAPETT